MSQSDNNQPNNHQNKTSHNHAKERGAENVRAFFDRADSVIELANRQLSKESHAGQVTASLTYAAARFAVSSASIGFVKGSDFLKEKQEIIAFYSKQYEQMLSDNIDDYAENFAKYTNVPKPD